ncbi:hypothetical protein [Kibdelosporangium aridum]|nr:hypothetical protein [Kibdelosporangium aridum]
MAAGVVVALTATTVWWSHDDTTSEMDTTTVRWLAFACFGG